MLGRAAYHNTSILADVDHRIYGEPSRDLDTGGLRDAMMVYADDYIAKGGRLNHVTRHMVGLFQGLPGARRFRQILSSDATKPGAGSEVIAAAFDAIDFDRAPVAIDT